MRKLDKESVSNKEKKTRQKVAGKSVGQTVKAGSTKQTNAKKKKGMPAVSISVKILALCQIPMIIVCILVASVGATTLKSGIEDEIEKSLQIVGVSVDETYTNLYEGDYTRDQSGKVKKGDTKISGETKLIDGLKEQTGFEVSFLYGNMRLITTLTKESGAVINGTNVDKEIYSQVETGEPVFLKDYDIADVSYYVYYQPLVNSDGSVIGAIEVATPAQAVSDTIHSQIYQIIIISVICVVVAAILVTFLSRGMVTTMRKTKDFLKQLSAGKLDAVPDPKQCKKKDELGDVYRNSVRLQEALRGIVSDIKDSADNLTEAANVLTGMAQNTQDSVTDVYRAVEEISDGARNQADETSDANHNVLRIGEQIDFITTEVASLTEYAGKMAEAEKASEAIIQELNVSNESTKGSVSRVSEQITVMNDCIRNITKAVSVIQDIADETDLLSLNASIEAARAGEAGRGFAVVAEQICKLADQSKTSATEIEKVITQVTGASKRMVEIMGEVEVNMDTQQSKLEETSLKYAAVADGVTNSLHHIEGIQQKMDVLSESGNAIREVVEGLSAISGQNAASADSTMQAAQGVSNTMTELKTSSEKLLVLADRLEQTLQHFQM